MKRAAVVFTLAGLVCVVAAGASAAPRLVVGEHVTNTS
jgi:hypothetical protein